MQTRYLFVLIHIRNNGEVDAAKHVMPSSKYFYRLLQGSTSFVDLFFLFVFHDCHAYLSVPCSLVVICCED